MQQWIIRSSMQYAINKNVTLKNTIKRYVRLYHQHPISCLCHLFIGNKSPTFRKYRQVTSLFDYFIVHTKRGLSAVLGYIQDYFFQII